MPETTFWAHGDNSKVKVGARNAEYLSVECGVRVTAVTEGDDGA